MLRSPPSSLRGRKGWCRLHANLPPALDMEERGILSGSSQTGSMGLQLAAACLLCWEIIVCIRIIMAGEEKTPLKRCPAELPALHAGCSPGSCQAACSPCLQSLSPAAGRGHIHTRVSGGSTAQGQEELRVWLSPDTSRSSAAQGGGSPMLPLHCKGSCWGSLRGYRATRLHCSLWDRAPTAPEQREEAGDTSCLGQLSCWDWGHQHTGNLSPAAGWTHSAHAPLPGAGTRCSHRGETCPAGHSSRGALCSGELSGRRRTPSAGWTVKSFPMGVQPRDPGIVPSTPGDVAGALMCREMWAQGTGRAE